MTRIASCDGSRYMSRASDLDHAMASVETTDEAGTVDAAEGMGETGEPGPTSGDTSSCGEVSSVGGLPWDRSVGVCPPRASRRSSAARMGHVTRQLQELRSSSSMWPRFSISLKV